VKTKTHIIPEKTGGEYYNLGKVLSFSDSIGQENTTLGDILGQDDCKAKMVRLKTYILSIPQYKYLTHQRKVIELLVEGYAPSDIAEKLSLKKSYISNCITNFRIHAKKYLTNLKENGIV